MGKCENTRKQLLRGPVVKNPPANAGDASSIPGSRKSSGEGYGNPFQYSCLENPKDRGAWWAIVHRVTKSQTQLKRLGTHMHALFYPCSRIFKNQFFLVAVGLHWCAPAFSSGEQGLLLVAVHGLLLAVASLVVEHRL